MHELSIAMNIIEIVDEEMNKHHAEKLIEIVIEIGKLSGVVPELLEFALKESFDAHPLRNAEVIFNIIDARAECNACHSIQIIENMFTPCIKCGSFDLNIIEGKELNIKSLVIE